MNQIKTFTNDHFCNLRPQLHRFRDLYSEALSEFEDNLHVDNTGRYEQDDSPDTRRKYILRFVKEYNTNKTRESNGISKLSPNIPCKFGNINGSSEIPLYP